MKKLLFRMTSWAYDAVMAMIVGILHNDPIETGKISDRLYAVRTGTVNFYIYANGEGYICIDSGFGKSAITRELGRLSIDPGRVTHVFLTHSDIDHAAGTSLFKNAQIYLSADEEQMITGKKARMLGCIYNSRIKGRYNLLKDGDIVDAGAVKVRAIATPGHTPGSMSYLADEGILFVGDTFKLINNKVYPIRPYINMDTERQKESIRKLAHLKNIRLACTAHRGYTNGFTEAISEWSKTGMGD